MVNNTFYNNYEEYTQFPVNIKRQHAMGSLMKIKISCVLFYQSWNMEVSITAQNVTHKKKIWLFSLEDVH
jgi:hypothetical protein